MLKKKSSQFPFFLKKYEPNQSIFALTPMNIGVLQGFNLVSGQEQNLVGIVQFFLLTPEWLQSLGMMGNFGCRASFPATDTQVMAGDILCSAHCSVTTIQGFLVTPLW